MDGTHHESFNMITLDIETAAIEPFRPTLPEPVGVALRWPLGGTEYLAWGHPTGNNCTRDDVEALLHDIWDYPMLTHNGAMFDIPVLQHWFALPPKDPLTIHDTLILAYLHNPHAQSLHLKDLADRLAGMPPTEQRELQDWILANTPCRSRSKAGAWISKVPGDLVAPYAIGDVDRTWAIYQIIAPMVLPTMQAPYDRERKLAPILVGMQTCGVRVDTQRLAADAVDAEAELETLDEQVRTALAAPALNLDADSDLVAALSAAGHTGFTTTETGKLSANKHSLDVALADDPGLRAALARRSELATLVRTFMRPWLEQSSADGRIYPSYNAIRNPEGFGTRTGRLSSSAPNLQNVPPTMREYILPEAGHVWVTGDFKSQEPRLAAHFEDGALLAAYRKTPDLDQYLWIAEVAGVSRKQAKTIFLGLLYSMGVVKLAAQLGVSESIASELRDRIRAALPDVAALNRDVMGRFKRGQSITTLGGRVYHCEPASNGRTFEYKALNVLIQGSAADQAKEALIYVNARLQPGERIVGMVHDEISISCPPGRVDAIQAILAEAACALPCDAPMLMDCGDGATWGEAK